MKRFTIVNNIKGTRVVDVYIPNDVELPTNWINMEVEKQDEFLYKWQARSVLRTEDIDYGKAIEIWQTNEDELVK